MYYVMYIKYGNLLTAVINAIIAVGPMVISLELPNTQYTKQPMNEE